MDPVCAFFIAAAFFFLAIALILGLVGLLSASSGAPQDPVTEIRRIGLEARRQSDEASGTYLRRVYERIRRL